MSQHPPEPTSLSRATVNALQWTYGVVIVRSASMMLIGIVLARLLGPEPFGLIAVAGIVIGLCTLIADFGFGAALVQAKDVSADDVRFVFTWQLALALVLSLLVVASAPLVALLFDQPGVAPIVRALAPLFLINAFGQVAVSLLKRRMDFKALHLSLAISFIVGYGMIGLVAAYAGLGVWSLVVAQLAQSLLYNAAVYVRVRHSLLPLAAPPPTWRALVGFGGGVISTNIVNWFIGNLDTAVIGRFFSAASLGFYNRTFSLMAAPMNAFTVGLQNVLFPAYSRAQDNPAALRRTFTLSLNVLALATLPLFACVAAVPHTLIGALLGASWLPAAALVPPLALAMPVNALLALGGPLLWALGHVRRELAISLVTALVMALALLTAAQASLVAVAWAVLGVYALRLVLTLRATLALIELPWPQVGRALRGPLLAALVAAAAVRLTDQSLSALLPDLARLGADVTVGALALLLVLTLTRRWSFTPGADSLLEHLPVPLSGLLRWYLRPAARETA